MFQDEEIWADICTWLMYKYKQIQYLTNINWTFSSLSCLEVLIRSFNRKNQREQERLFLTNPYIRWPWVEDQPRSI